jgi:hypothetical protein
LFSHEFFKFSGDAVKSAHIFGRYAVTYLRARTPSIQASDQIQGKEL